MLHTCVRVYVQTVCVTDYASALVSSRVESPRKVGVSVHMCIHVCVCVYVCLVIRC